MRLRELYFAGTSFFLCSSSVTPSLKMGDGTALEHPSMQDLVVSRVSGTPASGTIGILWYANLIHPLITF